MFTLNLNFWQNLVKITILFVFFWGSVFMGLEAYNEFKSVKTIEVMKEVPVFQPQAVSIDELVQGQEVKWKNYNMCVSSIEESNINNSQRNGVVENGWVPVIINLRLSGEC